MSLNFLTPQDLESSMKKQLEEINANIEKSQAKMIDKMKKAMRVEFRHLASVHMAPAAPTATAQNNTGNEQVRSDRKLQTKRLSMKLPFKSMNAKLNDADELDTQERRETIAMEEAVANQRASVAFGEDKAGPSTHPSEDLSARDDESEKVDSTRHAHASVRGLQMEVGREVADHVKEDQTPSHDHEPALAGREASIIESPPHEPLLNQTEGQVVPYAQAKTTINWMAILQNPILEGSIVCIVILNSLWIGAELEYKASVSETTRPVYFDWIDGLFCALFSAELLFRISVLGCGFFRAQNSQVVWNYLDLVLVLSQIMEFTLRCVEVELVSKKNVNVSWLRILRILRIVRLTRIVRTVRFLEGLRTLTKCLVRGMLATGWITLFLFMQIYTCSLAFTELLHWIRGSFKTGEANGVALDLMFGSLSSTMGTLCKSITGGITWDNALEPLMEVSPPLGLAFMMYVSFSLLVILNIFTGFFVNTSSMCADEDNKTMLRDRVADIFVVDENDHYLSSVSEEAFTERVNSPEMQAYFNQIDLHVEEAEGLFKLLDLNGQGTLDPIQIVSGLMRMRGTAKALDLRVLMYLVTKAQEESALQMNTLDEKIARVYRSIDALHEQKEEQKEQKEEQKEQESQQ